MPTKPEILSNDEQQECMQDMLDNMDKSDDENEFPVKLPDVKIDNDQLVGKSRKRKKNKIVDDDDLNFSAKHFEDEYAALTQAEDFLKKRKINLLPIKNKDGDVIVRTTEVDYESDTEVQAEDDLNKTDDENESQILDSDDDIVKGDSYVFSTDLKTESKNAISTADLLILREQEIARQKYRIGIICSGILEKPEDKMSNFLPLFELMDERNGDHINLVTVRKISTISLCEVFKDILPEYRIGQVNLKMQTVRKNTMERIAYENILLQQYKKYLQKLEKFSSILTKPTSRKLSKLAEAAVNCMCDLLLAHPYFNFGQNICQLLVYLLNCNVPAIRTTILKCFTELFKTDKKFDLTLFVSFVIIFNFKLLIILKILFIYV